MSRVSLSSVFANPGHERRDVRSLAKACPAAFFPLRCLPPSLDVFVYVISSSFSCPNIEYSLGLVVYTLIFSIVLLGPTI